MSLGTVIMLAVGLLQGLLVMPAFELCTRTLRVGPQVKLWVQLPLALILLCTGGALLLWLPLYLIDGAVRQESGMFWFAGLFGGLAIAVALSRYLARLRSSDGA